MKFESDQFTQDSNLRTEDYGSRINPPGYILLSIEISVAFCEHGFINVLRGEMSLVGPRPCLPYEAREYRLWQRRCFDAVPGMTGLWQASGKNRTTFKEMVRLDIKYARKLSLWMDIRILLRTVPEIMGEVARAAFRRSATQQAVDDIAPRA